MNFLLEKNKLQMMLFAFIEPMFPMILLQELDAALTSLKICYTFLEDSMTDQKTISHYNEI
jgi:hypothetical protein